MTKLDLSEVSFLTGINANFQKIEDTLNNEVLFRDNPEGEPNSMNNTDLDMNGNRIFNLPAPGDPSEAARLQDILNAVGNQATANLTAFTPAGTISANNVQGAIQELDDETQAHFVSLDYIKNNSVVDSVAELRTLDKTKIDFATTKSYHVGLGKGGGDYRLDATDVTSIDNGGTIIVANDGGRWKLQVLDRVSTYQFGAKGDAATNDFPAFDKWLSVGGQYKLSAPKGNYILGSPITWQADNTDILGDGQTNTIFNFNFAATSAFYSSTIGVTQRFFCKIEGVQLLDNGGVGTILDLKDMMVTDVVDCFTFGKGGAGSIGVKLWSTNITLQSTYNRIINHFNGNTQYGIYLTDGANGNTIKEGRLQSPVTGAIGILFAPTAFNLVNGNSVVKTGIEQPGNTMVGVQLNGNTVGTKLDSLRLEALLIGIVINSTDTNTVVDGVYYDSCTTNIVDNSTQRAVQTIDGLVKSMSTPVARGRFQGATGAAIGRSVGVAGISRTGVGVYVVTLSEAMPDVEYQVICTSTNQVMAHSVLSTTQFQLATYNNVFASADATRVNFVVYR